jgi:hypothetical protein
MNRLWKRQIMEIRPKYNFGLIMTIAYLAKICAWPCLWRNVHIHNNPRWRTAQWCITIFVKIFRELNNIWRSCKNVLRTLSKRSFKWHKTKFLSSYPFSKLTESIVEPMTSTCLSRIPSPFLYARILTAGSHWAAFISLFNERRLVIFRSLFIWSSHIANVASASWLVRLT